MPPLRVGLVGAGPQAQRVQGPMLAAGPETALVGVWSRTPPAAEALSTQLGVKAFDSYEALLEAVEAVAFVVAPSAQPGLAVAAAQAGRAVLLEKPLAVDVAGAERIVSAVASAGVGSLVVLSYRFSVGMRAFLDAAPSFGALGGRATFLSGAFLSGPSARGWRLERGALLDVGPHVLDLIDAALGPVVSVRAAGDVDGWVSLTLQHEGGAASDVAICCRAAITPSRTEVELFGPSGVLAIDARAALGADWFAMVRAEFAATARAGHGSHPLDAARGLHLQHLVAAAEADLRSRERPHAARAAAGPPNLKRSGSATDLDGIENA